MKVDRNSKTLLLQGEDGETLAVMYDNRGEPYREGISVEFHDRDVALGVFLHKEDTVALRDLLNRLYPPPVPK